MPEIIHNACVTRLTSVWLSVNYCGVSAAQCLAQLSTGMVHQSYRPRIGSNPIWNLTFHRQLHLEPSMKNHGHSQEHASCLSYTLRFLEQISLKKENIKMGTLTGLWPTNWLSVNKLGLNGWCTGMVHQEPKVWVPIKI